MNNSKKVVITLIIVTFILTGIISYYFIADNEKIIIQAPAITIEVNGSKNVINFTVIEVICNFTNQNNLSNFSYSISNFNQQNVSWNYLGENKSNDPQLDFIDDTTSIGFLSATDRFIVKCSTIHYQLLTLKFNPTNEIIYKHFLLDYDLRFDDNLTGDVIVNLNVSTPDAYLFIQQHGGKIIENFTENSVWVQVYNPNKAESRLDQVNNFNTSIANSSFIKSIFSCKYEYKNITGRVMVKFDESVLSEDAILLIEQCGGKRWADLDSLHIAIVNISYTPGFNSPNEITDKEKFVALHNFITLIDSSPLVIYVELDRIIYPDWGPVDIP